MVFQHEISILPFTVTSVIKLNQMENMWDVRSSQQWPWRVVSSGIQHRVVRWQSTDVSEEHIAANLQGRRVGQARTLTCSSATSVDFNRTTAIPCTLAEVYRRFGETSASCLFSLLLDRARLHGGVRQRQYIPPKLGTRLPHYTTPHSWR
jgi:hypothetical protein